MAKRIIALGGCLAWALIGCMTSGIEEDASEAAIGQDEAVDEASSALGPPHFQIVKEDTTFQGDCGDVTPEITTLDGSPAIELLFPELRAQMPGDDHKLCRVRLHVKIDPGYKVSLNRVFYQGRAEIDKNSGRGTVSARAAFFGLKGIDGYKALPAGYDGNFDVDLTEGTPSTACGVADTYMNLTVDLSARASSGGFSEVAIQDAAATPDPERRARLWCGAYVEPC